MDGTGPVVDVVKQKGEVTDRNSLVPQVEIHLYSGVYGKRGVSRVGCPEGGSVSRIFLYTFLREV